MAKTSTALRILALGLPGVIAIVLLMDPPAGIPRIALAANPMILLIMLGAAGLFTAQKAGFKSEILLGDSIDRKNAVKFGAYTIAIGILIAVADVLTIGFIQPSDAPVASPSFAESITALIIGLTYGGVTEEILMRWGLMSVMAFGLMKLLPRETAVTIAIVFAAGLFAAGHLPILFATIPDVSGLMIARVLILNGLLGLWFGWLFARHNLETAILAHAGFHIGVFLFKLVL